MIVHSRPSPKLLVWLTHWRKSLHRNSPFVCSDLCRSRGAKFFPLSVSAYVPPTQIRPPPGAAGLDALTSAKSFAPFLSLAVTHPRVWNRRNRASRGQKKE